MTYRFTRLGVATLLATTSIIASSPVTTGGAGHLEVVASGLDNPRGITVNPRGYVYIAEAGRGGEALVDTPLGDSDGAVCVVNPCGDQALFPADAVPTDVAIDHNGDYVVTTLGGFPFAVGESLVYKIDRHHDGVAVCSTFSPVPANGCDVLADRLTALVGIDVAPDGSIYVVQMADNGLLAAFGGDDAGSVQVLDGHSGEVVGSITGLNAPGGVAIHRRHVYITNHSVSPGAGEVVVAHRN